MNLNFIKNVCLSFCALIIIFYPQKNISALSHYWVEVPKSQYGEQLWDKNNVQENQDGTIRVFSKFLPKSNSKITKDILYTMDINCAENVFKDIAVGTKEFDEFRNKDSKWKDPNGDKLIMGVINQVCTFGKNETLPRYSILLLSLIDSSIHESFSL